MMPEHVRKLTSGWKNTRGKKRHLSFTPNKTRMREAFGAMRSEVAEQDGCRASSRKPWDDTAERGRKHEGGVSFLEGRGASRWASCPGWEESQDIAQPCVCF